MWREKVRTSRSASQEQSGLKSLSAIAEDARRSSSSSLSSPGSGGMCLVASNRAPTALVAARHGPLSLRRSHPAGQGR